MELDDFKTAWASAGHQPTPPDHEALLSLISKTSRGIRRSVRLDTSIGIAVALFFLIMVKIYGAAVQIFQYKLMVMAVIYAIPIYVRMFRSIRLLDRFDFGRDMKEALTEFRDYYRGTLRFYRWSTYIMLTIMAIILLTDESFTALTARIQIMVLAYMGLAALLTAPLVNRMYGRQLQAIENQLSE